MAQSKAFLSPYTAEKDKHCFICCNEIKRSEKPQRIGEKGYESFKISAEEWSQIDVPVHDIKHRFTEVYGRLECLESDNREINVHANCRVHFRNNVERYKKNYGLKDKTVDESHEHETEATADSAESPKKKALRSQTDSLSSKYICFICNLKRDIDNNSYNEGGLTRCDTQLTADKLMNRMELFLKTKSSRFYSAAKRLNILLSGQSHDIFAVDIYYHQSCYIKYALKPATQEEITQNNKKVEEEVLDAFLYKVKTQIIRDKNAFLLNELLLDVKIFSEEHGLETPALSDTRSLKRFLTAKLKDDVVFYPSGKFLIVHSPEINPCEYSLATLRGSGLRDEDLSKSFGRMIRRKLNAKKKTEMELPLSPEEFLSMLDEGPLPEIYNAIYYSMHDNGKKNEYGYVITSRVKATKIWSLASDWETLMTGSPSPKQAIMGLVLHRITGKNTSYFTYYYMASYNITTDLSSA